MYCSEGVLVVGRGRLEPTYLRTFRELILKVLPKVLSKIKNIRCFRAHFG